MKYSLVTRKARVLDKEIWLVIAGSYDYILASGFSFFGRDSALERVVNGIKLMTRRGAVLTRTRNDVVNERAEAFANEVVACIPDEMIRVSLVDKLYWRHITPFEKKVFFSALQISMGEVRTYGDLAVEIGTTPRAVGQALARNPFSPIIPCHRVVGRSGIHGFAGSFDPASKEDKEGMIKLEKEITQGSK